MGVNERKNEIKEGRERKEYKEEKTTHDISCGKGSNCLACSGVMHTSSSMS